MKKRILALLLASAACASPATDEGQWRHILKRAPAWYQSDDSVAVAKQVLAYQDVSGGWPKNRDMTLPPTSTIPHDGKDHEDITGPTIDNGATTTQIRFLLKVNRAHPSPAIQDAAARGLRYLLDAQYPNGGWPQFFPSPKGYAKHITFNDDAMVLVLEVLDDASKGAGDFAPVSPELKEACAAAVERGIACILACQIREQGTLTAWCAQHDEKTLAPAAARKFEPVSRSGMESVGIVRFLMSRKHPSPEVVHAVESAIAWFRKVEIHGIRLERFPLPGSPHGHEERVVQAPDAPPLWARFYELETDRPLFMDRDSVKHYALADIGIERRTGYRWYVSDPAKLLEIDYPKWKERLSREAPSP